MKRTSAFIVGGLLALAGCGEDARTDASGGSPAGGAAATAPDDAGSRESAGPRAKTGAPGRGTAVVVGDSEFGPMLFDSRRQAIYVFQNDSKDESACYGKCAEAWPPVPTQGRPRAGKGVDESLLGTAKRRDGTRQVTYADKPLYFYAHEGRGEVRCHNVDLNGGLWWVIGPDGNRRP